MEELQTTNPEDLFEQLSMLKGETCFAILHGMDRKNRIEEGLWDSTIALRIGDLEKTTNRGAVSLQKVSFLLIIFSTWRAEKDLRPFCSWAEKNSIDAPMRQALEQFIGKKIIDIELNRNTLDLTLNFEEGYSLRIFASLTCWDELPNGNYALLTPQKKYWIDVKGVIFIEDTP